MKTIKVIGNCCLVFLTVIAILVSLGYCYYHFIINDKTMGINNINDQLAIDIKKSDELTEEEKNEFEERYFMEASYFSNAKNNGIELQELKYNYFTGFDLTQNQYRSTGMQYIGDFETYMKTVNSDNEANSRVLDEFYYYDTTNGLTWSGFKGQYGSVATTLNRDEQFIIKIDNKPYSIQLTGKYDLYGRFLGFLWTVKTGTVYFDYGDVFDCVFKAIKSNDKGYGDYYITLDLSQYFNIREYDTESKKFKTDNVTDIIKNYAVLKFHYDENGAKNSTQSLFGIIECNSKYDLVEDKVDTTYWQERMLYSLTEKDFTYRYSDTYKGYFASLNLDTKKLFAEMPRTKVNISIDLQSEYLKANKINIVGFDYNGLENFEIDTLQITGESQTFYMLEKALYNTKLQTLKYSNGITFDFGLNAINSEYVGVIL